MYVHAKAKAIRISPRKIGLVAGLVRGRSVEEALTILDHTPKKAAPMLRKVISSAAANASHNYHIEDPDLTIKQIDIGHGPRMRRTFTVAKGSAHPFMKRTSHVHVVLDAPDTKPVQSAAKDSKKLTSSARIAKETNS